MLKKIQDIQSQYNLPGIVVGVLQDNEYSIDAFGNLDAEGSSPVTPETAYGIGSISKVFTATLAMRLAHRGILDLDKPLHTYVQSIPLANDQARQTITMRHLLTHKGGFGGDGFIENGTGENALAEWVEGFVDLPQVTAPGATWSYSNTGIGLAGHILALINGTSYEDAIRQEVLEPLGLHRTGFGQPPAFENSSTGYEFGDDGTREARIITGSARSANPAGGLVSTVPDLLRFAAAHLGQLNASATSFLPGHMLIAMQTPQVDVSQVEKWGIGWGLKREGSDIWTAEHGGWFNGFRAQLTLLPDRAGALAILTTGPKGHEAIEYVQEVLLEDAFQIRPDVNTQEFECEEPHPTGTYTQSHITANFVIDEETNDLVMHLKTEWHGKDNDAPILCPLTRVSSDEYVVSEGEFVRSRVTFINPIPGSLSSGVRVLNRICLPA